MALNVVLCASNYLSHKCSRSLLSPLLVKFHQEREMKPLGMLNISSHLPTNCSASMSQIQIPQLTSVYLSLFFSSIYRLGPIKRGIKFTLQVLLFPNTNNTVWSITGALFVMDFEPYEMNICCQSIL